MSQHGLCPSLVPRLSHGEWDVEVIDSIIVIVIFWPVPPFSKTFRATRVNKKWSVRRRICCSLSGSESFPVQFPGWRPKRPYPGLYYLSPSATKAPLLSKEGWPEAGVVVSYIC